MAGLVSIGKEKWTDYSKFEETKRECWGKKERKKRKKNKRKKIMEGKTGDYLTKQNQKEV